MATTIDKNYVGDQGLAIVATLGFNVSLATTIVFKVKKPDATLVEWVPSVYTEEGSTQQVRYVTLENDLDQIGTYKIQAYVEVAGYSGRGTTADLKIYDVFK